MRYMRDMESANAEFKSTRPFWNRRTLSLGFSA